MLIDSFLDYLQFERNYSRCTIISYSNDLHQFEDFVKEKKEGIFDPVEVDADIVRQWMMSLLDKGMAASSVNRKLSSLKSFFKFLKRGQIVSSDPLHFLAGPKKKKPLPVFVKDDDMEMLLDSDGFGNDFEGIRNQLILEILYETGIRRFELLGLRDVDIDFAARQLKVTGKRNKQRLIPFAERLEDLIRAYLEMRNRECGKTETFLVREDGTPMSAEMVYKIVRSHLSTIPTLSKCSPHVLRHSFATSMLNNGAELKSVKELLGHASLASTSIYTHTTFEELKKVYHAHPRAKKEGG